MENLNKSIKPKLSAGFFFLSLGVLITLATSVTSFIQLAFQTLNKKFPDVLNSTYQFGYQGYGFEEIRMALATLIIFFPVFLIVSYFWEKYAKGEMGSADIILRKWVIYIILFFSAVILMIDLVTLIRYFISGEITSRFILKVVVVLITALIVGEYYVLKNMDNKLFGYTFKRAGLFFSAISTVLFVGAIVYSFMIMGSPIKQRMLRLDQKRLGDLQNIQYQVINYWQQKEKLPSTLQDLSNPLTSYSLPVDPEFNLGKKYEYEVKGPLTFSLCADFAESIPKGWQENGDTTYPMMGQNYSVKEVSMDFPGGLNESWSHEAGHTCFERTIDKDIYPPFPKPEKNR